MKSEQGQRLQAAMDNSRLHSATHMVRWHRGKTEGGWYDKIAELYFARGKLVEFVKRKRKRKSDGRQDNLV
jgi:hypothetical protein